jgi:hypothetical protein
MNKIPKDLDTALIILESLLHKDDLKRIKEQIDQSGYHQNLGRSIRNNWNLWSVSILSTWFKGVGINHPDDMSAIILDSLHRKLNNKPIELMEQIKVCQEYWGNTKIKYSHE